MRYHDPANWPLLRDALKAMGRADLIGNGKKHLVPAWQPKDQKSPQGSPRRPTGCAKSRTAQAAVRKR
jgi:hypothetical protein